MGCVWIRFAIGFLSKPGLDLDTSYCGLSDSEGLCRPSRPGADSGLRHFLYNDAETGSEAKLSSTDSYIDTAPKARMSMLNRCSAMFYLMRFCRFRGKT